MSKPDGKRILYIEDDQSLGIIFKVAVESNGYQVDLAVNGNEGLALHDDDPYDLIAVDYQLPDMTGLDVARKFLTASPFTPIIIVTGRGNEQVAAEALRLGVYNYVIKDSEKSYIDILPNVIESALRRAQEHQDKITTDKAFRESEERLRQIANISSDWVWEMDSELRFSYFSDGFQRITGVDPELVLGKTRREFSSPEELEKPHWQEHLACLDAHQEFRNFQFDFIEPNGQASRRRVSGFPLFDANGNFAGYRGTCSDVSEFVAVGNRLRESEDRLKDFGDIGLDWYWELDENLVYTLLSVSTAEELDFPIDNYLGKLRADLKPMGVSEAVWDTHIECLEAHRPFRNFIQPRKLLNGETIWLSVTGKPLFDDDSRFKGYRGTATDITKLKQAEEALKQANEELEVHVAERTAKLQESENRLSNVLNLAPEAVITTDANLVVQIFNKGAERIFGYEAQEMIGQSLERLLPDRFRAEHVKHVDHFRASDKTYLDMSDRGGVFGKRKNGSEFPAEVALSKMNLDNETLFTVMLRDVTEHVKLEAARLQAQERFNAIVSGSPAAIVLSGLDHKFLVVNKTFEEWMARDQSDLLGKTVYDLYPNEEAKIIAESDQQVVDNAQIIAFEFSRVFPDGQERHILVHKCPIFGLDGEVTAVSSILTDISEMKRAEIAAHESEARLSSIVANMPVEMAIKGLDGKYELVNSEFEKRFDMRREDVLGKTIKEIKGITSEYADEVTAQDLDIQKTREIIGQERTYTDTSGKACQELVIKFPVINADDRVVGVGTVATDITRLKDVETKLSVQESRFRTALDNMAGGIFMFDKDLKIQVASPSFETVYQYPPGMVVQGASAIDLFEFRAKRGDYGPGGPGELVAKRVKDYKNLNLETKEDVLANGQVIELKLSPMPDGGVVGVFNDITERKQAEEKLQLAMENVIRANQIKSDFMANMSHELRTPLNAILGFSDMIGNQFLGPIENERYVGYAKDIGSSGQHLLNMVNDILDIERIEAGKYDINKTHVDIPKIVNECVNLLGPRSRQGGVSVDVSLVDNLPPLLADWRTLMQILINLITNSVKFTPEGGQIELAVSATKTHHKFIVRDTGIGIPEDKIPLLTVPFTRHDPDPNKPQDGVGLGLAICNSLVELHDGSLEIESEVCKGTVVTVTLPSGTL